MSVLHLSGAAYGFSDRKLSRVLQERLGLPEPMANRQAACFLADGTRRLALPAGFDPSKLMAACLGVGVSTAEVLPDGAVTGLRIRLAKPAPHLGKLTAPKILRKHLGVDLNVGHRAVGDLAATGEAEILLRGNPTLPRDIAGATKGLHAVGVGEVAVEPWEPEPPKPPAPPTEMVVSLDVLREVHRAWQEVDGCTEDGRVINERMRTAMEALPVPPGTFEEEP